ncbi:pilus assembly protein TadG-related protein [Massilia sp. MB5]|uniref:pilus assembly protein TadG-related protein n=1 Tax=Massilia sp. MB5 TaxID=2919578 RepID=UPI001F10E744|nr:pilus assembly protein TadG-related protein [Massilia sp. MB5]UMR30222.1 pilus assembly protein TadG-related protein [Massilia sp. MB5]
MMKAFNHYRRKQQGAVAVISGLALLLVLLPMGGLVLDLGHLYIAKSELQNAADAAALAGAKDLNNTAAGIDTAIATGQTVAGKNRYDFATAVSIPAANFTFSDDPDGPWVSATTAKAAPQGMTFMKVETGSIAMNTYLMHVAGISTVSTFGTAVAGRFVINVTPIGICAIDPANRTSKYTYAASGMTELVEFGFRRGVSYDLFKLGSLGGASSDPYQINPVDSPPGACSASNSSANFTAPFMCTGNSAVLTSGVGQVYTNTGMSASLDKALNSRFGDYSGGSKCDPASAPPDLNIKEYPCKGSNPCKSTSNVDWMSANQNVQNVATNTSNPKLPKYSLPSEATQPTTASTRVPSPAQVADYGPLWSYSPAYQADGSTPPKAGARFTPSQANLKPMYSSNSSTTYFDTAKYPTSVGSGFDASSDPAPYNQTGNATYYTSGGAGAQANRRILNLVLIDCRTAPVGPASCGKMTAVGVGKFFMKTKADFSGGGTLDLEFTGLIEPVPTSEVKLYR